MKQFLTLNRSIQSSAGRIIFCLLGLVILLGPAQVSAALSGIWKGDTGGTFYIQEDRGKVYWYAEQLTRNPYWAHVFTGKIKDLKINGTWIDVPKGKRRTRGRLQAELTADGKYILIKAPGFGITRLYRWENKPVSADSTAVMTRPPIIMENCVPFNPASIRVSLRDGRWTIAEDNRELFDFDRSRTEAEKALSVIQHYKMNSVCTVGEDDPVIRYLLVDSRSPLGKMQDEDCVVFNPANLSVRQVSGNWMLVDGNNRIFDFDDQINEAKKSLELIRKYHFSRSCYIGRPDPSFNYLRQ